MGPETQKGERPETDEEPKVIKVKIAREPQDHDREKKPSDPTEVDAIISADGKFFTATISMNGESFVGIGPIIINRKDPDKKAALIDAAGYAVTDALKQVEDKFTDQTWFLYADT